ncbi:MAG: hypothetical protein EBY30_17540 [Rhodospirillales bacterium]|jgi:hypothetical protein|nr:hypothetical protein [Rhodospirillales bacterium]
MRRIAEPCCPFWFTPHNPPLNPRAVVAAATVKEVAPAATVEVINLAEGVTNVVAVLHRRPEVLDRRAERLGDGLVAAHDRRIRCGPE